MPSFAPGRHTSSKSMSNVHYSPVFIRKNESSESSPDSRESSLSSENDESSYAGPLSFYKGSFFTDLTASEPQPAASEAEEEEPGILGCAKPLQSPLNRRMKWRRISPTSEYFFDKTKENDGEEPDIAPFIEESPPSPPHPQQPLQCFEPSGLARVEDHFTIRVLVRASKSLSSDAHRKATVQLKPRILAALADIAAERQEERKQQVNGEVLNVEYAKHPPSSLPLTFYHHVSTSSDEMENEQSS